MDVKGSILGNAVLRVEDPNLLTGDERFVDDLAVEGALHVHFVRSTLAHGLINEIDTGGAETMPGVVGVFTAANTDIAPMPYRFGPQTFARPIFASERVRLVGDIVGAVVAETQAQAIDAAEAIFVDYEDLDVVLDPEVAASGSATLLFPEAGTNVCSHTGFGEDIDALADAEHVTELRIHSQRLAGVPMEPNGVVAIPESDRLSMWIPSQAPQGVRNALAKNLDVDVESLRVAVPKAMGGGFGSKNGLYTEQVAIAWIARHLDRPCRWVEGRSENMVAMNQGRDMILNAKMGFTSGGKITGLSCDAIADVGAYAGSGAVLPTFTQVVIQGVYDIPKVSFSADAVVTNRPTIAAYRGAGRPEATQMLERIIDIAASELGIDPIELRRRNFIDEAAFPFTAASGAIYDNGAYEKALDRALEEVDIDSLRADQAARRERGDSRLLGVGVCTYVEVTAPAGLHVEYGKVEVTSEGKVIARVGTSAHGQGHITSFSMIVADQLGVPIEDVTVLQSDTDDVPKGSGTMGSRSLQTAGSAVFVASERVFEKATLLAGNLLEAAPEDIVKAPGGLAVAGVPAKVVSWAELSAASQDEARLPEGMEPGLEFELDFDGTNATFPFGAHLSVVEVDADTGQVEVLRHIAVDDAGKILNPLIVTGQQHGGIAQGISQALYEEVRYDDWGNPVTSNLADYALPAATEFTFFDTFNTETPTFRNPLGAKGIGESGTIGSTSAVHNAVLDAISHLGVRHLDMPLTPQKVWHAMNVDDL